MLHLVLLLTQEQMDVLNQAASAAGAVTVNAYVLAKLELPATNLPPAAPVFPPTLELKDEAAIGADEVADEQAVGLARRPGRARNR